MGHPAAYLYMHDCHTGDNQVFAFMIRGTRHATRTGLPSTATYSDPHAAESACLAAAVGQYGAPCAASTSSVARDSSCASGRRGAR